MFSLIGPQLKILYFGKINPELCSGGITCFVRSINFISGKSPELKFLGAKFFRCLTWFWRLIIPLRRRSSRGISRLIVSSVSSINYYISKTIRTIIFDAINKFALYLFEFHRSDCDISHLFCSVTSNYQAIHWHEESLE